MLVAVALAAAVAVMLVFMLMIVAVALVVMLMLVIVAVALVVVLMLVLVAMAFVVVIVVVMATANMVVMDMHSNSSFAFFYIIAAEGRLVKTFIFWRLSPIGACFAQRNPL
jgi:hypothetical protein